MYITYVRSVESISSAFNHWLASLGKPFHKTKNCVVFPYDHVKWKNLGMSKTLYCQL